MSDLERVQLVARMPCEACAGEGEVLSEDWRAFEAWSERQPADPEHEDRLEDRYFLDVCGYEAVPAAREPCEACDGSGHVEGAVPLAEVVQAVLEEVDQPVIPRAELAEVIHTVKQTITDAAFASRSRLTEADETGSWLRTVQEGAEALRSLGELATRRRI